jgi:hypothetical protein
MPAIQKKATCTKPPSAAGGDVNKNECTFQRRSGQECSGAGIYEWSSVEATKQTNCNWKFNKVFESKRGRKVFKTTVRNAHRKPPNGKTKSVTNNRLANEDNDKAG